MNALRVLLVHNAYQQSGGEDSVVADELALLRRKGHEVIELRRDNQEIQTISLPDHFDFSGYTWPASADAVVLCTEKDAVKLFKSPQFKKCSVLAVPLEFLPEPAFFAAVDALLQPLLIQSSQLPSPNGAKNGHKTA